MKMHIEKEGGQREINNRDYILLPIWLKYFELPQFALTIKVKYCPKVLFMR